MGGTTFVDVGSGAGRALLAVALASDFAVVRGEEILESLHMVACEAASRAGALLLRDEARAADLTRALRIPLDALRPPPPVPIFLLRLCDAFDTTPGAASAEAIYNGADRSQCRGRSTDTLPWPAAADLVFINAPCMPEAALMRVAKLFGDGAQENAQIVSVTRPLDAWHASLTPISASTEAFEWGEASVFTHAVRRRAGREDAPSASQFINAEPSPASSSPLRQRLISPPESLNRHGVSAEARGVHGSPQQQPVEHDAHRAAKSSSGAAAPAAATDPTTRESARLSRVALVRRGVVLSCSENLWADELPRIRAPSVVSSFSANEDVSSPLGTLLRARKTIRGNRSGSASDDGVSSPLGSMLQARKAAVQAAALELSDDSDDDCIAALSPLDSADSAPPRASRSSSPTFLTLPARNTRE